jgi:hypothetical protein
MPNTRRISPRSTSGKHGFVRKAAQPAARASRECPATACPVRARTGMNFVRSSFFKHRVASRPSSSGSDRSIRMRSGSNENARSSASFPVVAWATRNPENDKNSVNISRLSSKSSTIRTNGQSASSARRRSSRVFTIRPPPPATETILAPWFVLVTGLPLSDFCSYQCDIESSLMSPREHPHPRVRKVLTS